MKNSKQIKLFVLILSFALIIGAAVGIAASAEETEGYEIEAINVIYKDRIFVAIAVDAPVEKASEIEVSYTFDGKSYTAEYHSNVAVWEDQGDDTLYPVFVTIGIPAKDQGEDIIAEAHVKGSGATGTTRNVSVASYLYERLYKDGIITATEEEDVEKKGFYLTTLEYISYAQEVLYNNANPDKTPRTHVTDYVAVYAQDAKINGTEDSFYLMKEAGNVTLEYTGTGTKAAWTVTAYNDDGAVSGTSNATGNTVSLTSSAIITPLLLDFEIGTPTMVETFETCTDNYVTAGTGTINAPSFGDYVYTTWSGDSYTNTTGETVAELVEYTTANGTSNALNMFTPGRINSDGSANSSNRSHSMEAKIMESVVPEGKENAVALEFDLKLGLTIPEGSKATKVSTSPIQITLRNYKVDGYQNSVNSYLQFTPTVNLTTKTMTISGVEISGIDNFVRIKIVADLEDKVVHVYANGVLMGSVQPTTGSADYWTVLKTYGIKVASISTYNSDGMCDVYLDNVSFYETYSLD